MAQRQISFLICTALAASGSSASAYWSGRAATWRRESSTNGSTSWLNFAHPSACGNDIRNVASIGPEALGIGLAPLHGFSCGIRRWTGMNGRLLGGRSADFELLAVSSGGGHWEELMLLRPGLTAFNPIFAATDAELFRRDGVERFYVLPDANRDGPWRALRCLVASIRLVLQVRPSVLVTTGALPGLFCLITARFLGCYTIWIDSIANSDQPSLSGRWARPFAHDWFTQWAHLEGSGRRYDGALL
jgi:hypothetical protein